MSQKVAQKRRTQPALPVAMQLNSKEAIVAFVGAVLTVNMADDDAVLTLLDQHCPGHDRDRVTDDDREVLIGMRAMIERMYSCVSQEADEHERTSLRTAVRAWHKSDAVKRREPDVIAKRIALVQLMTQARDGAFSRLVRTPAGRTASEMDRVMVALSQIDQRLWYHRTLVRELVEAMRRGPTSPRLAAAKLTRAAGVFGDGEKLSARVVRSAYDTACGPMPMSGRPRT